MYTHRYYMVGFSKWKFLPERLGNLLIRQAILEGKAVFNSIHKYTSDGLQRTCPIYIDLDGSHSKEDCRKLMREIYNVFEVYPMVWFSGNKGYHLIIPHFIEGEAPEKIVKFIVKNILKLKTIDLSVYTSKRLWRVEGSTHPKTGIKKHRLFEHLECSPEKINKEVVRTFIATALAYEEPRKVIKPEHIGGEVSMVPCINEIMTEGVQDGEKHNAIVEAAKFWKFHGGDSEELIAKISENPFWVPYLEHIQSTVLSVFSTPTIYSFGCKNNELLKKRCSKACVWRREL